MDIADKRSMMKRPSDEAVKLANSIYYTAVLEDAYSLRLSLKQLCKTLDNCSETDWFAQSKATELLDELSEPVAVENFTYERKEIEWQAMSLLTYAFHTEGDETYIDIELDKMFIDVMSELEAEPYINFQ